MRADSNGDGAKGVDVANRDEDITTRGGTVVANWGRLDVLNRRCTVVANNWGRSFENTAAEGRRTRSAAQHAR